MFCPSAQKVSMSTHLHRRLEQLALAAMLTGIISMFQPWLFGLFGPGFLLLLVGTVAFTIISNISPRNVEEPMAASSSR